ncbi:MAG TPA: patatin-like phospholipase family protein [Pseudonocardiaceae bacterium]|jgi:NTE family protein|nr:patatin-like phospholipase family protein [Pseudonocardiaceae bacterium]
MNEIAPSNALVLGGGGPAGASWMAALLNGLRGAGVPLAESDVVVGTSAGSVVGSWLTIQPDGLTEVPAFMHQRAAWHASNSATGRHDTSLFETLMADAEKVDRAASSTMPPISAEQADELWRTMLPDGEWPSQLRMMTVNAGTGQARAWSADDGIPLTVGVACSTAAPGIAPPVAVDGGLWVDGGVRTGTNADLIVDLRVGEHEGTGPGRVLVVAPIAAEDVAREEAFLRERGYRVRVIVAERFYNAPFDLIDPRFIDIGAISGAEQADKLASELLTWWNG